MNRGPPIQKENEERAKNPKRRGISSDATIAVAELEGHRVSTELTNPFTATEIFLGAKDKGRFATTNDRGRGGDRLIAKHIANEGVLRKHPKRPRKLPEVGKRRTYQHYRPKYRKY